MEKIFSFDAETNGLWGEAFAIGAVVKDGAQQKELLLRCPITAPVNQWVNDNVLPKMKNVSVNCSNYEELLRKFFAFYMENKKDADIIVHMGLPVEARLFIDAHNMGIIGDRDAPYPLIDIAAYPEIGTSVDRYNKANNLQVYADPHNPLYDSFAALLAYCYYKEQNLTTI